MRRRIQETYRSQLGPYLQFFALLLLTAVILILAVPISGCGSCDESDDVTSPVRISASAAAPAARQVRSPEAANISWAVNIWLDASEGLTLTTGLCQEWNAKLQGNEFFVAARMPMSTTVSPIYSPTLYLDDYTDPWGSPMLMTATLTSKPERLPFLTGNLPSAPGEGWTALGISNTVPISCPAGLNTASWGLRAEFLLDTHDQPDDCRGCTMQFYYCYEGQDSPLARLEGRTLARSLGVEAYQGEGITCLGPKPIHLEDHGDNLHLGGTAAATITPTLPITMHEYVDGLASQPVTVTLDYTSTVSGWQFYGGDWQHPYITQPITAATPIKLQASGTAVFWAVNNPVPANTAAGPHTLVITATVTSSPTLTTWTAIPLWAGDWVAPPLPQTQRQIYLPLVLK